MDAVTGVPTTTLPKVPAPSYQGLLHQGKAIIEDSTVAKFRDNDIRHDDNTVHVSIRIDTSTGTLTTIFY